MIRAFSKIKQIKNTKFHLPTPSTSFALNQYHLIQYNVTPNFQHFSTNSTALKRYFAKKKETKPAKKGKQEDNAQAADPIDLDLIELQYQEITQEFTNAISKLKFGNLSPEQLESIEVKAYNDICALVEVAQVIPKNDKSALLHVYDPSVLDEVKIALDTCSLDLSIQKDAQGFLVTLANANSKEARLAFANGIKQKGQASIQKLRNVRGDEIRRLKTLEDASGVSEDYLYKAEEEIHNMYLATVKDIEAAITAKTATVGL